MRSIAIKKTVSCPPAASHPRKFLAAILAPSQGAIPAPSHVTVLAIVQLSRWLLFHLHSGCTSSSTVAVFQRLFCGSVSAGHPSTSSSPPFSFSTPGSWPPAQLADQWEIQAQAFCLGWHFAFVSPSRL